jgi:hypothetical protein
MKHILTALFLTSGTTVMAQNMPSDVSDMIAKIRLEEVKWHPGDKQADLEGKLAGTWVEIDFHRDGGLEEIETKHGGLFPASAIAAIVPEVLASSADYPSDASFTKIEFDADQYEIEGRTAQGEWFEAKFDGRGRLEKWDRN